MGPKNRQKDWTQKSDKKLGQMNQTNDRTIYIGQKIGLKITQKIAQINRTNKSDQKSLEIFIRFLK